MNIIRATLDADAGATRLMLTLLRLRYADTLTRALLLRHARC